MGKIQSLTAI